MPILLAIHISQINLGAFQICQTSLLVCSLFSPTSIYFTDLQDNMKASVLFTLLVLSTLLWEAHGTRLGKVTVSASSSHQEIIKSSMISARNQEDGLPVEANEVPSGMNRKLMTKTTTSSSTSSTTAPSKKYKIDGNKDGQKSEELVGKEAYFTVSSSPERSEHRKPEVTPDRYPDVIDIAGMDYSPARRKPPIHN